MRLAANRLKNTDIPVAEIAFDLGYADASNFTRAFRGQTGVSAQAFRASTKSTAGHGQ
jgi:AraC-like DNA-binding protein